MKDKNILLVDLGNTSTCVSVGNGCRLSSLIRIKTALCDQKSIRRTMLSASKGRKLSACVLSSVVPKLNHVWVEEMTRAAGSAPIIVNHSLNLGLKLDYPKPATIGADRLANVCGAVARHGFPVIVADFGTATTFDVVNSQGTFTGGVIAPGLRLMSDYMADRTALLPRIKVDCCAPAIGRSTGQAMQIGAIIGYRGLVREITKHLINQNNLGHIKLVATGGLSGTVLKGFDMPYQIDLKLTLWGIYRIYKLNS